ncbi:hypothetical protein N0V95_002336 [Ascochyta clinopodiicola]|nr:hypothetical protein N0V95_002336 [Ascochyta clinopodiicola]
MADNKRQSMAGKVATPALKASGGSNKDVGDADSNLYKAVGSRIKITCAPNNNVLEGTLFTACNTTNAIAINTAPAPPNPSASLSTQPGDYHIIPFAHILSFEIVGLGERAPESNAGFDGAIPSIAKVDMAALIAREEQTIREMKKKDAQKGKGVSREAQEIYDTISRTIRAPAGKEQSAAQVKKIVERYYQQKRATGGATKPPVATPIAPRKGG